MKPGARCGLDPTGVGTSRGLRPGSAPSYGRITPMAEIARRLATWEDLLATPADNRTYEIIGGELEAFPRPRPRHGLIQARLSSRLSSFFDDGPEGPGGWWLVIEPDVELGPNDIVAPDVVGWRREHLPELPDDGPIRVVPDWVCEVISPSHPQRDRVVKAKLYLNSGVPFYWLLDPESGILEAFAARDAAWVRLGAWSDRDTARIAPFEAVELDIGRLFPRPPQTT